jgi:DNA-binding IclR family transcriptional regulator
VQKLAVECGDTVFLMVRSGYDTVCIDRHTGDYPVKAFIGEVGTRRPLGVGASGVILLAGMTDQQISGMLDFLAPRHLEFRNTSRPVIEAGIEEVRRLGYAYSAGQVMTEVHALGVPVRDRMQRTIAALSIAGIRERISLSRRPELVSMLMSTKHEIEASYANRD